MRKYICLFALLLNTAPAFAQSQGEFVIELDPATGTFTKMGGAIPGIHYVYPEVRAYDEVNGRMIFQGGDPTPDHLYSIDVSNGSVVSSPLFPPTSVQGDLKEPQFDNTSGTLYGIYKDDVTSEYFLAIIDPATGAHTLVGSNPILSINGLNQGMDTYDEIDHHYILSSSGKLISIDALSGNVVSEPQLGVQSGQALIHMSFNNANDTLYGLMLDNNAQLFFLVWIDLVTGTITEIGNGTTLAMGNGSSAIDQANHRFIYSYSTGGGYYLSVMDLNNGNVLFNNQIVLDNLDNVHSLKYDNQLQKLFAIHWDNQIGPTNIADVRSGSAVVYPNPANEELFIRLAKNYQNIHVALYNAIGQELRSFEFEQADECIFQLHDLSSGVYFLKFETPEERFSASFTKQ